MPDRVYRLFFVQYAFAHLAGGALLFVYPPAFQWIVREPPGAGPATLIAFLSAMVGFGFAPAAWVTSPGRRRLICWACVGSNLVNGGGHVFNALTGEAPEHVLWLAVGGIGSFMAVLAWLLVRLPREP